MRSCRVLQPTSAKPKISPSSLAPGISASGRPIRRPKKSFDYREPGRPKMLGEITLSDSDQMTEYEATPPPPRPPKKTRKVPPNKTAPLVPPAPDPASGAPRHKPDANHSAQFPVSGDLVRLESSLSQAQAAIAQARTAADAAAAEVAKWKAEAASARAESEKLQAGWDADKGRVVELEAQLAAESKLANFGRSVLEGAKAMEDSSG